MFITEETEVAYKNLEDLSYIDNNDETPSGRPMVALYVNNKFEGDIEVWYDAEMEDRPYVCINYEIIYLDTIKEIF